jgi:hypothetical protein
MKVERCSLRDGKMIAVLCGGGGCLVAAFGRKPNIALCNTKESCCSTKNDID